MLTIIGKHEHPLGAKPFVAMAEIMSVAQRNEIVRTAADARSGKGE